MTMFPLFLCEPRKVSQLKTAVIGNCQIYLLWFRMACFSKIREIFLVSSWQNIVRLARNRVLWLLHYSMLLECKPPLGMQVKLVGILTTSLAESLSISPFFLPAHFKSTKLYGNPQGEKREKTNVENRFHYIF